MVAKKGQHSHLDRAGYRIDQKAIAKGESLPSEGITSSLLEEERWWQVLSSLVICLFARGIYPPEEVQKTLAVGFDRSVEDLHAFGADNMHRKYAFKSREGFDPATMLVPRRIMETSSPAGPFDEELLCKAIALYNTKV